MEDSTYNGTALSKCSKAHVVVFPYPAQGHINPMLLFSEILASKGLLITFVNTEVTQPLLEQSLASCPFDSKLDIRMETIPDPLPPGSSELVGTARELQRILASEHLVEAFTHLIQKLMLQDSPPVYIISDFALSWCNDIADKFGICKANFYTASLASCVAYSHAPLLVTKGYIPITGPDYPKDFIDCISGIPPILHVEDLPSMVLFSPTLDFVINRLGPVHKSRWILANSFDDLEAFPSGFDVPTLRIGPLVPATTTLLSRRAKVSLLPEDELDCQKWLDGQKESSVLYISFGTSGILSSKQIEELAMGLKASEQPFLWSFRADTVDGKFCYLPAGFKESTKSQGRVVTWASQFQVLSHPSIGGFLTHCGWNSVMESMFAGVPMLAWPYVAEQRMNARFLTEEWRVAMEFEREGEMVGRAEVERKVRALIVGEEGQKMRREAEKWKESARRAILDAEGSSQKNVNVFVQALLDESEKKKYGFKIDTTK